MKNVLRNILLLCCLLALLTAAGCGDDKEKPFVPKEADTLVINEVMSANRSFAQAQDGGFYDWVELYNGTGADIDLTGYGLSDSYMEPLRWSFPPVTVKSKDYITVYLSGLDTVSGSDIHTNFKLSAEKGEPLVLSDAQGVLIEQVEVPAMTSNVSWGRDEENLTGEMLWFVGATPGEKNTGGVADKDALRFPEYSIRLNEYMIANRTALADSEGAYYDFIELYNPSASETDLSGFGLSDSQYDPSQWVFPVGSKIGAGEYLIVFCSGLDKVTDAGEIHTNFSLSARDKTVGIYTPQGQPCSVLEVYNLPDNVSSGLNDSGKQVLFATATPGAKNSDSFYEVNGEDGSFSMNDGLYISEALSVSSTKSKYPDDWLEICNGTGKEISLGGYGLSTDRNHVQFTFPDMTLGNGEYVMVYCTGKNASTAGKKLCAAFKLNAAGDTVYLTSPMGGVLDTFSTGKQRDGISSGRLDGDVSKRWFFSTPTPGASNSTSKAYETYVPNPVVVTPAGYVSAGTKVEVKVPEGCYAVVTTNGSEPASDGKHYDSDFTVNISKTTVLKVKAFCDGKLSSDVVTQTYLVEKKHKISVVSLSSEKNGLFGYTTGILADGPGYTSSLPHYGANYWKDWERSAHIEYYTEEGRKAVEFDCGLHTFGQYGRGLPQKGLALILREMYGANEVAYPFFTDNGVASYKSLLLRPEGQDWNRAKLRDVIVPGMLKNSFSTSDYMDFKPVALYINGEYWGLYYLREKLNENYIVRKYGYEKGTVDVIKGQSMVRAGTKTAYNDLFNKWLKSHPLTNKENYEYFCSQVDLESFMDFWIIETFSTNHDTGNIRQYKAADGKWHWMPYDFDWGFMNNYVEKDMLQTHMYDPKGHGANNNMRNLAERSLLANKDFCKLFYTRYIKALKTYLNYENSSKVLASIQAQIVDEIPRQAERWGQPTVSLQKDQYQRVDKFLKNRPIETKKHLKKHFGLSEAEYQAVWDSV